MRFVLLISVIDFATAATNNHCDLAKAEVESFESATFSPINGPILDESEKDARRTMLFDAARALIDAVATDYETKESQCRRVFEAIKLAAPMDLDWERWSVAMARITVLLGGGILPHEADDVVLQLGARIFALQRRSRVSIRFGEPVLTKVFVDLQTLKFFETHGSAIAHNLLSGLDILERSLNAWENMRSVAANKALENRRFLGTSRPDIFWSHPAGYVLAAICEVTSVAMLDISLANELYGPVLGVEITDEASVVVAISPLVEFSKFNDRKWLDELMTENMTDLLKSFKAADLWMFQNRAYFHCKVALALPGLVFVRWIAQQYNTNTYKGKARLALAGRVAKVAVKLVDVSTVVKDKLDEARQVVVTFLDENENDDEKLKSAFAWFNKIPWALKTSSYFPGDTAYTNLLVESYV